MMRDQRWCEAQYIRARECAADFHGYIEALFLGSQPTAETMGGDWACEDLSPPRHTHLTPPHTQVQRSRVDVGLELEVDPMSWPPSVLLCLLFLLRRPRHISIATKSDI